MSTTVTTQAELDKALADKISVIYISAPAGVWIRVGNTGSSHVEARGSSHVVAWESSHVEARDSSHVVARGSSHVVAWGSSHVVARDSSHVEARGSSHVVARGSSHVVARDSSHVEARGSSHVEAASFTAVHLWSQRVTLDTMGAVIDMTKLDLSNTETWLDYYGVEVSDGKATLYKGVSKDLLAGEAYTPTTYAIGSIVTATDWLPSTDCGYGLHLSPTASATKRYRENAERFLAVEVEVSSIVPLGDKVKVPTLRVLHEVNLYGEAI